MSTRSQNSYPKRRRGQRRSSRAGAQLIWLATVVLLAFLLRNPLWHLATTAEARALGIAHRHVHGVPATAGRNGSPAPGPADSRAVQASGVQFASGACVEFRPTARSRGRTIFVDPGHGGPDPGATGATGTGTAVSEKDLTLKTGLTLLPILRADGYAVVMSRTADTSVAALGPGDFNGQLLTIDATHKEAQARTACANAAHADLFLSIHFNSAPDASTAGTETIYDDARPFTAANQRWAQAIQKGLLSQFSAAGLSVPDRGAITDSSVDAPALSPQGAAYGHFLILGPAAPGLIEEPSQMPGAIAEPFFVTRPAEVDITLSNEGQQLLARGFEAAVNAYFGS